MRRRPFLATTLGGLGAGLLACRPSGETGTSTEAQDLQKVAADLQVKTTALIDAINSKNDANINRAKLDLQKQADTAEDAVKSETGPVANQINSAVNYIRTGALSNSVTQLERARGLLQQAAG
jgi:hypothetical protein